MTIIRIRDYRGPVVAATCGKCYNDNLKPFGGPALNFCSHCGTQFPRMFNNPLQQPLEQRIGMCKHNRTGYCPDCAVY